LRVDSSSVLHTAFTASAAVQNLITHNFELHGSNSILPGLPGSV